MAVGGERDVEWGRREGGAELRGLADEVKEAVAQQGLATGKADLLNTKRDEDAQQAGVVGERELGVLCAVRAGAAVDTAVVAAVGDREPEVGDGAAVRVAQAKAIGRVRERRRCGGLEDGGGRSSSGFECSGKVNRKQLTANRRSGA
jgi:uncharacterized protein YdbL (DUF1318 family)